MKKMDKTKDIMAWTINNLFSLIGLALFAAITVLIGELINYSPWSLLIVDAIFILSVNQFTNKFFYSKTKGKNRFWVYFVILSSVLGVIISIGVAWAHPWAILNIVMLIFLFFFSSIIFGRRRENNNLT